MVSEILTTVADNFIGLFGSPALVAMFLIALLVFILVVANVGKVGIFMIIIPLVSVLATSGVSKYINISGSFVWVNLAMWLGMGAIFATVFWFIIR